MSSPEKPSEMQQAAEAAGHPPAVKAGGMRIVQNKTHLKDKKTDAPVPKPEEDVLKVSTSPPKQSDMTSGAPQRGNEDFPADAVKAFHQKPLPTHDTRGSSKPTVIHQPRK